MNDRPIRVLAICHEDPAWILGGMGMHCRELYRHLAKREDVEIDFVTNGPGEGCELFNGFRKHQADKLVCYKPRTADLSSFLFADMQFARTLARMIADGQRWDLVHEHEWTSVQLGRMMRDALDVPLVGTMHLCITKLAMVENPACMASVAEWPEIEFYLRQQEGNLIADPDETILCSKAYVDIVRETFLTRRPIHMIYNGIDPEVWHPTAGVAARVEHDADRLLGLYVGRIATMKGIEPLLSALEAAHPERLRWIGFQHGQDLHDLYTAADAVIMPSIHEPFGIVALEAMASGCPLLATAVDGLGEIVRNDSEDFALIIPPNDPRSIVTGLAELRDSQFRATLAAQGLKRIEAFSWEVVADQTVDVYRQALRKKDHARNTSDAA